MINVAALWRHPIKSHGREALQTVALTAGQTMPFDRTWAVMHSRGHVVPEDLQMVLPAVAGHRLVPSGDYAGDGKALVTLLQRNVDVIRP